MEITPQSSLFGRIIQLHVHDTQSNWQIQHNPNQNVNVILHRNRKN